MDKELAKKRLQIPADALDRREFLRLMGASLALAGFTGCNVSYPVEEIVPYVRKPSEITPGEPLFYATAATLGGYALGVLAESREGHPTKIEGNPLHPASLGAADIFAQSSILELYDPDRSKDVLRNGQISTWISFYDDLRRRLENQKTKSGAGLRILTETVTSPTLFYQLQRFKKTFPNAVRHQFEPVNRDNEREGAILAFGADAESIYNFEAADVVLSLDADFLFESAGRVRYARDFAKRRTTRDGSVNLNRLYAVESMPSVTGSVADHRIRLKSSEIASFAFALASKLGVSLQVTNNNYPILDAIAADLNAHRGASIVVAGRTQPPEVHALTHLLNEQLGNTGKTISFIEPVAAESVTQQDSLRALVDAMNSDSVEILLILGGNPVYDAPSDFNFAENLQKVAWSTHLGKFVNETAAICNWHLPQTHEFEAWSDARAFDGTVSIIQPLIAPLTNGKSAHEILAALTDAPETSGYEIVRAFRQSKSAGKQNNSPAPVNQPAPLQNAASTNAANQNPRSGNQTTANTSGVTSQTTDFFDKEWRQFLRDGIVPNSAAPLKILTVNAGFLNSLNLPSESGESQTIEIVFRPDPCVWDGRFANNGWLQELPKPITKLTWDNAALMSPATAKKFEIGNEIADTGGSHGQVNADLIELGFEGKSLKIPALIVEGHADDSVTVYLGYGRTQAGSVGSGTGFNACTLRKSGAMWIGKGAQITKTGDKYSLAVTQNHHSMEDREPVRVSTLSDFRTNPTFAKREADDPAKQISLYPHWENTDNAWGMTIDTGSCIGCNACVIACQSENSIPVVGKKEVLRAREMHWIRIDQYSEGEAENQKILNQPVPCMHCEKAPCEVVCPVEATTHSHDGLNEMTYNRCVGTRYCSNNCPYKVRRFNYFGYAEDDPPLVQLQRNPEVTVRSRGVMEKCTYCVQRIRQGQINAENEGRTLKDGEIVTACQQVCPTQAIIFGDINDKSSRVSALKREPTNYGLLAELNTRPRTTYLATVRNTNEEIEKKE